MAVTRQLKAVLTLLVAGVALLAGIRRLTGSKPAFGSKAKKDLGYRVELEDILYYGELAEKELKVYVYEVPPKIQNWGEDVDKFCYDDDSFNPAYQLEVKVQDWLKGSRLMRSWWGYDADLYLLRLDLLCRLKANPTELVVNTYVTMFVDYIIKTYPFYNRSGGTDHMLVWMPDKGPFCDPSIPLTPHLAKAIKPMVVLTLDGRTDGHDALTDQNCFRPGYDIALPAYHQLEAAGNVTGLRNTHVYYDAAAYGTGGAPGANSTCVQLTGLPAADAADIAEARTAGIASAYFAASTPPGSCWAPAFAAAVAQLTIPVLPTRGMEAPFARFLDYRDFTISVDADAVAPQHQPAGESQDAIATQLSAAVRTFEQAMSHSGHAGGSLIATKRQALLEVRGWFTWSWTDMAYGKKTAWRLLLLEMWCRTRKGRRHYKFCATPPPTTAASSFR